MILTLSAAFVACASLQALLLVMLADHLTEVGIEHPGVEVELGKPTLQLVDPDGINVELVAPAPRT